jgi:hypothetical protein
MHSSEGIKRTGRQRNASLSEGIGKRKATECFLLGASKKELEGKGMHASKGNGSQSFNGVHSPKGAVCLFSGEKVGNVLDTFSENRVGS